MKKGIDPRDNSSPAGNAEIQEEFLREKLGSERGTQTRMRLTSVHMRIGRRFFSIWWLLGFASLLALLVVVAARLYAGSSAGQAFITQFPCIVLAPPVPAGMPAFVRWTHLLSFFFLVLIVRSGVQVLADHPRLYFKAHCTPGTEWFRLRGPVPTDRVWTSKEDAIMLSPLVGLPGGRHTIGVARHWHFIFDILFVLNGVVYVAFLLSTPWLHRLVPTTVSILPAAGSCAITYLSLHLPSGPSGFFRYDALQQLTYFSVIFILAPLTILTGLAMSPALDNRFRWFARLFGNRQIARSIHFVVMLAFLVFFVGHMVLIALTGFTANLNDITLGNNNTNPDGVVIWVIVLALVVAFNVWAVRFSWKHTRVLQRIANVAVGRPMNLLFDHFAPRVEYKRKDISVYFWPNHSRLPDSPEWCALRDDDFRAYRLKVYGLVENPVELSLDAIKAMSKRSQITLHHCIQGWSGIAEWSGLPFEKLMELVRPTEDAEWVMFYSFAAGGEGSDRYYDSHSIHDLRHPQSLLAYEMNGEPLPILHGRPLRLRVENLSLIHI